MKAELYSTLVLNSNNISLTVYQGKRSKNVILLSSLHKSVVCSDNCKKTPASIAYYNKTKYGVDVLDQKARLYTTKVQSRRWPLQVFYNILDLSVINATIIYNEVLGSKIGRRHFILKLIEELAGHNEENENLGDAMDTIANELGEDSSPQPKIKLRNNCAVKCTKMSRNKTTKYYSKCKKPTCGKCIANMKKIIICKLCK